LFDRWNIVLIDTHDSGGLLYRLRLSAAAFVRLLWMLLSGSVYALHVHSAMKGSFWRKSAYSVLAELFRVPVIFHLHGSETKLFLESLGRIPRWVARYSLERKKAVVVLSDSWAQYIRGFAPRSNIVVLPNYVTVPVTTATHAHVERARPVTLLFLGAIGHRKGVYDLLPALKAAMDEGADVRLLIGGDGELERAKAMAQELGIAPSVQFLGWVRGQQKSDLLASTDIYILPSHNEGLPVSILEAMSYGIPVISTRVGGIPELVQHGVDGVLVAAGAVDQIKQAILDLAKDRDLRLEMSRNCRRKIEASYSVECVLPRLEAIYSALRV
jgi:glycosyltransferase involved in cell wall biosynthesis